MTARPSVATAGATQRIITTQSEVGTKIRCMTGQATAFDTRRSTAKPTHDMAIAGRKAVSSLARNRSRSRDREVEQRLERLALLLAGEGVGGQHGRHHEGDDQEQRRQQVAVDEHDELLALGQRRIGPARSPGIDDEEPADLGCVLAAGGQADADRAARPAAAAARPASG